jgi:chemotaxis signal transduction protein
LPAEHPLGTDTVAAEQAPARRACVVILGGRPFAVEVVDAREVVELEAMTPVPGAPAAVAGVMNLRGSVLAVLEARPLLGLPLRIPVGRPRALVVADGEHRAGVLIERVVGLAAFDDVQPLVSRAPGGLVVGHLVDEAGDRVSVLDARALLATVRSAWSPDGPRRLAVPRTPPASS